MAATDQLRTAPLDVSHAEAGLRLSAEAGWNQTALDWRLMLQTGEAIGQLTADGELVASALILPYGGPDGPRVAWIAMVLTTGRWRRCGLATTNLRWAVDRCRARGLIAGLDATPAGRLVYQPFGFRNVLGLTRLHADAPALMPCAPGGATLRPMRPDDLDRVVALEAATFGAERRHLMAYLRAQAPASALVAEGPGGLEGFVLTRRGRLARHIGPLCARHDELARALLARAIGDRPAPTSLDVPDHQAGVVAWLKACCFRPVRPFTRMLKDAATAPGDPRRLFAITGPEFG